MEIKVRVIPRAKFNRVELPKVWTTTTPTDGKANAAVIVALAKHFGVAKSRIKLIRGDASRDKVFNLVD